MTQQKVTWVQCWVGVHRYVIIWCYTIKGPNTLTQVMNRCTQPICTPASLGQEGCWEGTLITHNIRKHEPRYIHVLPNIRVHNTTKQHKKPYRSSQLSLSSTTSHSEEDSESLIRFTKVLEKKKQHMCTLGVGVGCLSTASLYSVIYTSVPPYPVYYWL